MPRRRRHRRYGRTTRSDDRSTCHVCKRRLRSTAFDADPDEDFGDFSIDDAIRLLRGRNVPICNKCYDLLKGRLKAALLTVADEVISNVRKMRQLEDLVEVHA